MSQFSLRARWVLQADGPPLDGGVISIDGKRIIALGKDKGSKANDLGDVIILPGLVNAHTHLEFSDCDRPLGCQRTALPEWIRQVIKTRHRADRDPVIAIQTGLQESLCAGVTTLGEISTSSPSLYSNCTSRITMFHEVIGFSAARMASVEQDLINRLGFTTDRDVSHGISPHAPYTVHPKLLERLVAIAVERNLPVAMHLAESADELELLKSSTGAFQRLLDDRGMWDATAIPHGSTPLDYLRVLAKAPRSIIIHGNYLNDDEISFLAKNSNRMSVVFCPRTHSYFGHAPYPLEKLINTGVCVALGTDSRASNPDLSLLAEMRAIARWFPAILREKILQMATVNGAKALGLANTTGELATGKSADLIVIPSPAGDDPLQAIFDSDSEPSHVFVRGQKIDLPY